MARDACASLGRTVAVGKQLNAADAHAQGTHGGDRGPLSEEAARFE